MSFGEIVVLVMISSIQRASSFLISSQVRVPQTSSPASSPQFLICAKCQSVKEIAISKAIIDELDDQVAKAGYQLMNSQLELQCLCEQCTEHAA